MKIYNEDGKLTRPTWVLICGLFTSLLWLAFPFYEYSRSDIDGFRSALGLGGSKTYTGISIWGGSWLPDSAHDLEVKIGMSIAFTIGTIILSIILALWAGAFEKKMEKQYGKM